MATEQTIHLGAVAPYKLKLNISSTEVDFDLSDVSGVVFDVLKPPDDDTGIRPAVVNWTATITGPTPRTATLLETEYTWQSGDLDVDGTYAVEAQLTLSAGGTLVAETRSFLVRPKFAL